MAFTRDTKCLTFLNLSIFILHRNVTIHQARLNARVIMDFTEKIVKTLMNAKLIEGVVNIIATTLRHNGTITHFD